MCLSRSIKKQIKKKTILRNRSAILASQLMKIFVDMFVYLNLVHYWMFVHQGIDLGLSEEEWLLHFLGPNGEIPQLHRAFSNTGYTSSEEDEENN
ncbi:unnamed protein product [Macrosiphum euphorbiae]|uniref:Uncharacterized protein n=1 Tax=Macrosiphum euphorbiae TaxID=13131 RepID=A0AAV0WBC7_9HEMI|nr:unnamed protein product [Macrosiphum euphorbiae]